MNKLFLSITILGSCALILLLSIKYGETAPETRQPTENSLSGDLEKVMREKDLKQTIGSCRAIKEKGSCIDYIGSMWSDDGVAEQNCKKVGTYSSDTCPHSEFGGCQTSAGSAVEMIIWAYREAPQNQKGEAMPYAYEACTNNPYAHWITPDSQLKTAISTQ